MLNIVSVSSLFPAALTIIIVIIIIHKPSCWLNTSSFIHWGQQQQPHMISQYLYPLTTKQRTTQYGCVSRNIINPHDRRDHPSTASGFFSPLLDQNDDTTGRSKTTELLSSHYNHPVHTLELSQAQATT